MYFTPVYHEYAVMASFFPPYILQGQIYFYSPLAQSVMKIMSKTKKTIQKSSMMSLLKLTGSSIYERNKAVSEKKNW